MNDQNAKAGLDSGHEASQWLRSRKLTRLSWLPIPLLAMAIIAARAAGLRESYTSETLTLVLSVTFYTLVSLGTLFLIGRSFLASGTPGLLLLECGVVLWSLAGTVGDAVSHGDANINVTIFNTGILVAGVCHLAGAILSLRPQRVFRARPQWLGAGCALVLGVLWLIVQAALANRLPVFFIPGQGGTPVRYCVLISAIAMFVLSAGLLFASQRRARTPFTSWYALALLLLAVGLFGVMIQLSLGSVVNWLGRTAQWLGGVYLLLAAVVALRESDLSLLPSADKSRPGRYRYGVAISIVIAATAVRFVLSPALGTQAIFLTFYPAVILAALYGGVRAGLLATVLSALIVDFLEMEPVAQFTIGRPTDWVNLLFFFLSCTMISFIVEAMHKARDRLILHQDHLEELVKNRTAELEQEVVEHKRAEEALLQSRELLRVTLESIGDAVMAVDSGGMITFLNPMAGSLTGWEPAEALGRPVEKVFRIINEKTRKPAEDIIKKVLVEGRISELANHTALIHRDGREIPIEDSAAPIRDNTGNVTGMVLVFRDVTEERRAEEALHKAHNELEIRVRERTTELRATISRLEQTNQELQDFAFVASHDLQEPLRKIQTFCDLTKTRCFPVLDGTGREYLDKVFKSANRMRQLLRDLLLFSMVAAKPETFKRIDLGKIVREAADVFETTIKHAGSWIEIGTMPALEADERQMLRLFQNLIGNCLKFGGDRPPQIQIQAEEDAYGMCEIRVKDNGIGFEQQFAELVFKPFQRLHNRSEYDGTGMGLAICRKIAERHGGNIRAESEPGKGSTFIIRLPARQIDLEDK